jgi:hypothetical protein
MLEARQSPILELRVGLLKARAQAKQKWLEQMLSSPAREAQEASLRKRWITRALKVVKRARTAVKYRAALLDAYAEHLSVLEMTLMGAAEEKPSKPFTPGKAESSKAS